MGKQYENRRIARAPVSPKLKSKAPLDLYNKRPDDVLGRPDPKYVTRLGKPTGDLIADAEWALSQVNSFMDRNDEGDVKGAALVGSRIRGNYLQDSDIDIYVWGDIPDHLIDEWDAAHQSVKPGRMNIIIGSEEPNQAWKYGPYLVAITE